MAGSWSGGLLAAVMTYLLLLQGITGAVAQGALSSTAVPDPASVICSFRGDHGGTNDPSEKSGGNLHKFCGILCQLAFAKTATLPGSPPGVQRIELTLQIAAMQRSSGPTGQRGPPHIAEARAPPYGS